MTMIGNIATTTTITMASSSSCSPFLKHIYTSTGGPPSESTSEISSVDSDWSDLKSIAVQLGVSNPDDLITERFKVDRTKLENMIRTDTTSGGMNRAEEFFDMIMKETSTFIGWPCRLKLGARTKKDPHVRIVGLPENVLKAKERVMMHLDSRGNRVIMKMDVSYTDHSFIIGRGGNNIRKIMEETATHIHFPDSNRSNPTEKSNQVSLCGNLEGVEKARFLVRVSAPLVISFELPIIAPGLPVPDNDTDYIKEIEGKFCVQVIFSTRPKLHSSLVLIKGSEKEYLKVKQATQILIGRICENITSPISVQMQLEISVQHHFVVAGKNSDNLRAIMQKTGTEIMFPDAGDINTKPIKRSQVTITGTIDGVYLARQQLIGNLPIVLIFDYPENTIDSEKIAKIMKTLDVFINVRQKTRQSTLCVVIKGIEKFIDKVYEARHQILGLHTPKICANIPTTYFSTQDAKICVSALLANPSPLTPTSPVTPTHPDFLFSNQAWNILNQDNMAHLRTQFGSQNFNISSPSTMSITSNAQQTASLNSPLTNISINRFLHPNSCNVSRNTSSANTSGYQSFSSSSASLEASLERHGHVSPDTTSNIYAVGCEHSNGASGSNDNSTNMNDSLFYNYERKKICGLQSMEVPPVAGELRVPTPTWSGMSLSRTSPLPNYSDATWNRNVSPYNLGVTTSLLDVTPKHRRRNLSQFSDIHTLLTNLGLEHYIKTFTDHEIDVQVFQSLSDSDLQSLGITALGPRRKLLLAIRDMAANQCRSPMPNMNHNPPQFSGSAAPGAERKPLNRW